MAAAWQCLLSLALLYVVTGTVEGETCTSNKYAVRDWNFPFRGYLTYEYVYTTCHWGCCGTYPYQYCCSYVSASLIVGIVFGCVSLIFVLIALVCCCIKKAGHTGRVVRPANNAGFVLYTGTSGQYPMVQQGYNYTYPSQPAQPPSYKSASTPPPEYNYSDPVYPPGAGPDAATVAPPPYSAPRPSFVVDQEASVQGLPSGASGAGPSSTTFPGLPPKN